MKTSIKQKIREMYMRTDKILNIFLGVSFSLLLIAALFTNSWQSAFTLGLFPLIVFSSFNWLYTGSLFLRVFASWAVLSHAVAFAIIFQDVDTHVLFIYVFPLVLIFYRDWRVFAWLIPLFLAYHLMVEVIFSSYQNDWLSSLSIKHHKPLNTLEYVVRYLVWVFEVGLAGLVSKHMFEQYQENLEYEELVMEQSKRFEINLKFAQAIQEGDIDASFDGNLNDKLGRVLLKIRAGMLKNEHSASEDMFKTESLSILSEVLRNYANSLGSLSQHILNTLIELLDAHQGIFYIKNQSRQELESWAYYSHVQKSTVIKWGEGLVGQVAKSNKAIHLQHIPEDYVPIRSALGSTFQGQLLIFPLRNGSQVIGVIELLSLRPFVTHELSFVETISEIVGSAIDSAQNTGIEL